MDRPVAFQMIVMPRPRRKLEPAYVAAMGCSYELSDAHSTYGCRRLFMLGPGRRCNDFALSEKQLRSASTYYVVSCDTCKSARRSRSPIPVHSLPSMTRSRGIRPPTCPVGIRWVYFK